MTATKPPPPAESAAILRACALVFDTLATLDTDEQRCATMSMVCTKLGHYEYAIAFAEMAKQHQERGT